MGYRSDVKCVFHHPDPIMFGVLIAELRTRLLAADWHRWEADKWADDKWGTDWELDKEGCFLKFRAEYVKWYESYPDVSAFEGFLSWCEQEEKMSFSFLRIGENDDDIDRRDFAHDDDIEAYSWIRLSVSSDFEV